MIHLERFLLVLIMVVFFHGSACADSFRVVTESWPPYVFRSEGRVLGFDYEVTKSVLESLGHQLTIEFFPWRRCVEMVRHGEADALLDVGRNDDRERFLLFPAEPLSMSETVVFFSAENPFVFNEMEDLAGKTVGTQMGYSYSKEFEQADYFRKEPVSDISLNIRKLLAGRIDLFVANRNYGLYTAREMGRLKEIHSSAKAISGGAVYLGFSRKKISSDKVMQFSEQLLRYKKTKECRDILRRYGQFVEE